MPSPKRPTRPAKRSGGKPPVKKGKGAAADPLAPLRDRINALDEKLLDLLNERAALVVDVGVIKRERNLPVYTPHREAEVLSRVLTLHKDRNGLLPDRTVEAIFRELMSGSFRLEQPPRIGYLGPAGSFSHIAASRHFGSSVEFEDLHTIRGVFTEVARGHADYGLAPIENSIGGGIAETLEAFQEFHREVTVYAEVQLEVHHALCANCAPGSVTTILSKPEVFEQCRAWLATQYPDAKLVAAPSSSRAVQMVAESDSMSGMAAIGSTLAAELAGVNVLFEKIEDRPNNITRFFVLARAKAKPSGQDKTSIMFTTIDKPGALVAVLSVFERAGINLSHIDKRPSGRNNWQYTFFIDAEGHIDDPWFSAAVTHARAHCAELTVLGSYPKSRRIL